MKKTGLLLVALLTLTQSAYAMLPLTENNIAAAQLYGSQRKGASDLELVAPWTVYDRKQTNRYGVGEKTVMYTPYLMAAIDAKSLAENGGTPTISRGMKVAKDTDIAFGSTELISGTKTAAAKMIRNPIVPIINAGFSKILSFVSSLCSLKIVLLASDILLRVKYIFRHLLFQSWPKSRIHKTIQYIYCQIHNHI